MTYEERQKQVCDECHSQRAIECGFVSRGLASKCSYLQDVMYGWELGQKDAKEQMMKGLCFETKVYLESDGCAEDFNESEWLDLENTEITELPVDALGLKAGDKVKVIIVKEG